VNAETITVISSSLWPTLKRWVAVCTIVRIRWDFPVPAPPEMKMWNGSGRLEVLYVIDIAMHHCTINWWMHLCYVFSNTVMANNLKKMGHQKMHGKSNPTDWTTGIWR
jgi:hypothetical protein